MIYSATLQREIISSDLKFILIASEFMKLFGCISASRNFIAMSNLPFNIFDFSPAVTILLFLSFPITGSSNFTLCFFADKGF